MGLFGTAVTAEKVGGLLTRSVLDAFHASASDQDDREWLQLNKATAAKILRFHAASAWFRADLYIQSHGIRSPSPQDFMKIWREAIFTQIVGLFDNLSEKGTNLLWSMLFDDIDDYARIYNECARLNTPLLPLSVGKAWFEQTQQMNLLNGYNSEKSGLLTFAAAADCQERVESILRDHCR